MARPTASQSTEHAAPPELLHAISIRSFNPASRRRLTQICGLDVDDLEALSDPGRIERQLRAIPALGLGVLEILVDAQGRLGTEQVIELASHRFEVSPAAVAESIHALLPAGLGAIVVGPPEQVSLFAEIAGTIAARVRGLTWPEPPEDELPVAAGNERRDRVCRLAAIAHLPVKVNKDDTPSLPTLRKLASRVGGEELELMALILRAAHAGILGVRNGHFAPSAETLREHARGERRLSATPFQSNESVQALASDRWTSCEALARALFAERLAHARSWNPNSSFGLAALRAAEHQIKAASLERREHAGHLFYRARLEGPKLDPGRALSGDGHVTPSFEVMLGPAADPELTAILALAAEPVRIDQVITLRLTPAATTTALMHGLSVDEIIDALGRVGRHAVPDNVVQSLRDWARSGRTARVSRVWSVELSSPQAADAAAAALKANVLGRPTPTLLLVQGDLANPEPLLDKAGVRTLTQVERFGRERAAGVAGAPPAQHERPSWLDARGAPKDLRERLGELAHSLPPSKSHVPKSPGVARVGPIPRSASGDFSPSEVLGVWARAERHGERKRFLELLSQLWRAAEGELAQWASEHEDPDEELDAATGTLTTMVPWLILTPRERTRALESAHDLEDLLEAELCRGRPRSGPGTDLMRLLDHDPEVRALVGMLPASPRAPEVQSGGGTASKTDTAKPAANERARDRRSTKPNVRDFPAQRAAHVHVALKEGVAAQRELWLHIRSKSQGDRIVGLKLERLLERGSETAILGTDLETGDGRSFPLVNVVAVLARDGAGV